MTHSCSPSKVFVTRRGFSANRLVRDWLMEYADGLVVSVDV